MYGMAGEERGWRKRMMDREGKDMGSPDHGVCRKSKGEGRTGNSRG